MIDVFPHRFEGLVRVIVLHEIPGVATSGGLNSVATSTLPPSTNTIARPVPIGHPMGACIKVSRKWRLFCHL